MYLYITNSAIALPREIIVMYLLAMLNESCAEIFVIGITHGEAIN